MLLLFIYIYIYYIYIYIVCVIPYYLCDLSHTILVRCGADWHPWWAAGRICQTRPSTFGRWDFWGENNAMM